MALFSQDERKERSAMNEILTALLVVLSMILMVVAAFILVIRIEEGGPDEETTGDTEDATIPTLLPVSASDETAREASTSIPVEPASPRTVHAEAGLNGWTIAKWQPSVDLTH
ncbi:uncharacterized protein LOC144094561 [Amblyomma americanum]